VESVAVGSDRSTPVRIALHGVADG